MSSIFLTIDAEDKRPLYQQIVDGVKALIARGAVREGTPLPSVRQVGPVGGHPANCTDQGYAPLPARRGDFIPLK